jgi:DNA-binding NtrC family response regulator
MGMTSTLRVLIVDDQAPVVKALQILLDIHGIASVAAANPEEACRIAAGETLGAVIQDMNFSPNQTSGEEGAELFQALRRIDPQLPILLMTAWASLEAAVELIKQGASDYLEKPWNDEKLLASLTNLVKLRQLEVENRQLRADIEGSHESLLAAHDLCGIVYASAEMHRVVALAVNVSGSDAPVLITGPSGSGKERIAEIIQANSRRRSRPFVRVNVGAIPEELIESELFGAEAGAYTGIRQRRIGHFETADSGTLFLDEIDALSLAGQVKLLRVLQSGELQRLGSSQTRKVDVRIISASNARLRERIDDGVFREDLYYRLNVVELALPALANRRDDVLPLARHFLAHYAEQHDAGSPILGGEAEAALVAHPWPGNVRELENRIQRALVVSPAETISAEDLDLTGLRTVAEPLSDSELAEREQVLAALSRARGVVAHAADELGISRQALYRKMARLEIELERRPRADLQER